MTRRILFLILAVALLAGSCSKEKNSFTIRGVITHAEGDSIYLQEVHPSAIKTVAETQINKKGEFKFEGTASIPTFYLLNLPGHNFIYLLVDSAENVVVEADAANFDRAYNVSGSPGSEQVKILDAHLKRTQFKLDSLESLEKIYRGNPDYDETRLQWAAKYDRVIEEQVEFSTNFVRENPFSMASVLAPYQKLSNDDPNYIINDLQVMKTAASALNAVYPQSEQVQALYNNTLTYVRQQQAARMKEFIEENGTNSPEIILPDVSGKDVALSSLRGKVVLLQFWAAIDRSSRIQNPVLVELYKKYKSRGFEIYQISVDENRAEWVDAIDADKLTWTNVGDMKGSVTATQLFNVQAVPFNYLLDRDGTIVSRNLTGPAIDKAIDKLLN